MFVRLRRKICYMFAPEQLRALQAVVDHGTIAAAADHLGYTPSAISQQLARLQKEAGTPLTTRRGRYVVPTDAAMVLVGAATQVQAIEERTRAELERLGEEVAGPLVVTSFPTALRGLTAAALRRVSTRHPAVDLSVRELHPEAGLAAVAAGDADLAVLHDWVDDHLDLPAGIERTTLGTDPVDLVLSSDHPLAGRERVDLTDLDGERWVNDSSGICSRWLVRTLSHHELAYTIDWRADEYQSQIALAAHGLGLCLVPRLGRGTLPGSVTARPLANPPTRRVFAVHRRTSQRRPAVGAMLAALREEWSGDPW